MFKRGLFTCACAAVLASCGSDSPDAPPPPMPDSSCQGWFGDPNMNTGLSTDVCFPRIEGDETWTARAWDAGEIAELRSWTLENPPPVATEDPYQGAPVLPPEPEVVCAFMPTGQRTYRLETFESVIAAEDAGGSVTHGGPCGACSSFEDLAVYAETPDQTDPVRQCTIENLGGTVEELESCIRAAVGFTAPCGRIWAYHAMNDTRECQDLCIANLDSPYNEADCSLNPCLQCDEDNSVPVFRVEAGRLRRNSGLAAAICRPCDTVWRVDHTYE